MKKLLLLPALSGLTLTSTAQLALQNFNAAGLPSGWAMINGDGKTISKSLTAKIQSELKLNAWMKWPYNTGDSIMITTSLFDPSGTADRWLISAPFLVSDTNTMLIWEDIAFSPDKKNDLLEIKTGPASASTAADFGTDLYSGSPSISDTLSPKGIPLGSYNSKTIRIAFHCAGTDAGIIGLDNIQTRILTPKTDAALTSLTPASGSSDMYGPVGSGISISGTIKNNGTNIITSVKVHYQAGTAPVVSETKTVSIVPFATDKFSFTKPVILTSATIPVKIWVELTGDANTVNDTLNTALAGYTTKPAKRIVAEEGTGTWCGWCVRGIIYMDSIYKEHPDNFSLIAVHNSDPMVVTAYDKFLGTHIDGYPSLMADRRLVVDPSKLFDVYDSEKDRFGLADIALSPAVSGSTLSLDVAVTPKAETQVEYRLALVLTEDDVSGTGTTWQQTNYYSGGSNGPLANSEYDFAVLPDHIPASSMRYDFVARGIYPGPEGGTGTLPANMIPGKTYNYTFSGISLGTWNTAKMHAIVLLINSKDGSIMNSQTVKLTTTAVNDVNAQISELQVYPNPATDVLTTRISLTAMSSVHIAIVDVMGKEVKTIQQQDMSAGSYKIPINVAALPSGTYAIKVTTDKGIVTERFSITR